MFGVNTWLMSVLIGWSFWWNLWLSSIHNIVYRDNPQSVQNVCASLFV